LFDSLPCTSEELPQEVLDEERGITGYDDSPATESSGGLMVIENLVFGDGMDEQDYAEYGNNSSLNWS
jgi:snRNA-activating protein complex subunit 3